jgi:hypothetical protein
MINCHSRVDVFLNHILPDWKVVDLGCGDQYLSKQHLKTINVDRADNSGVDYICNLDWEKPGARGDVAVMSGLLEWCVYPESIIEWALEQFPYVYFSYANTLADKNWAYTTTVEKLEQLLKNLDCKYTTEIWEGQTLFFATRHER